MPQDPTGGLPGFYEDYRRWRRESEFVWPGKSRQHVWMHPVDRAVCAFGGVRRWHVPDSHRPLIAPLVAYWSDQSVAHAIQETPCWRSRPSG